MDRAYFEESYLEWLHHKSRFRRWQLHVAAIALIAGCAVIGFLPAFRITGIVLVAIAILESVEFYWHRASWLNQRLAARGTEPITVDMSLDETGVHMTGPTSVGHVQWKGVKELQEPPKGLFFRIGDGMNVYVPKAAIDPQAVVPDLLRLASK